MAWKLTAKGLRVEPLPGVPWREMTDEEFEAAALGYAAENGFDVGALLTSGFFEEVTDVAGAPEEDS